MTADIAKIHQLAQQMEQALQSGQAGMFCALSEERMQAIGALCGQPREAGLDDFLREAAAQNRRWIAQALEWIESKKEELEAIRRKRRAFGNLADAYASRPSSGRFVSRHG